MICILQVLVLVGAFNTCFTQEMDSNVSILLEHFTALERRVDSMEEKQSSTEADINQLKSYVGSMSAFMTRHFKVESALDDTQNEIQNIIRSHYNDITELRNKMQEMEQNHENAILDLRQRDHDNAISELSNEMQQMKQNHETTVLEVRKELQEIKQDRDSFRNQIQIMNKDRYELQNETLSWKQDVDEILLKMQEEQNITRFRQLEVDSTKQDLMEAVYKYVANLTDCQTKGPVIRGSPSPSTPIASSQISTTTTTILMTKSRATSSSRTPPPTTPTTITTTPQGHTGHKYILLFLPNSHLTATLEIILTSKQESDAAMYSHVSSFSRNFTLNDQASHQIINENVIGNLTSSPGFPKENKGLAITVSGKASVYGISYLGPFGSAEGYSAIPVDRLGTEYKVISYPVIQRYGSRDDRSVFGIVSTMPRTYLNTTFQGSASFGGKTYTTGDVYTTLFNNDLETLSVESLNDLTGTIIRSSEPVGVVSGNTCSNLGQGGCSHMIEYLPPTKEWGRHFIVPNVDTTTNSYLVIIPKTINAVVNITSANGIVNTYNVNIKTRISNLSHDKVYYINSDEPILVTLLCAYRSNFRKAFMSLLPSTDQYSNDYVITVPTFSNFTDYIAIIIESQYSSQLLFDNNLLAVSPQNLTTKDNITWHVFTLGINDNVHTVKHPSVSVQFGVIQYGFKWGRSYGYPAGLNL